MDKQSETITGWRNAANHGRGSEMTNVIHAACDALETALDRIKVLEGALEQSAKRLDVIAEEIHEHGSCQRRSVEVYAFAIEARAALSGKEKV